MGHLTKKRIIVASLLLLVACEGQDEFPNSPSEVPSPFPPTQTVASPTPPAVPDTPPPASGPASASCVGGWTKPAEGSTLARTPITIIRKTIFMPADPVIVEMRYFTGPESPPSDKGYLATVERWYLKLYSESNLRFQGRFLVESREFGDGVVAVAPYDTNGFRSPNWSGFQWNEADQERKAYPGLPGRWRGTRYDFVRGGAGLDIPGLPDEVRGCLDTA
jgi:hypothetical protein